MRVDDRGRMAGQRTVTMFQASTDVAADYDELLLRRRSQRRNRAVALAAFAVVAVFGVLSVEANLASNSQPQPIRPAPGLDVGEVPVWYDDAGLHRGDVVDQTAVAIPSSRYKGGPGLTLVRTGALYFDSERHEVWFHPWGSEARVVGRGARYGAVGDPEGDNAAWWEGGELVVYDTVEEREIARVVTSPASSFIEVGYMRDQSGIMQVSSETVVWKASQAGTVLSLDLQTNEVVTVDRWSSPRYGDPNVRDVRAESGLAVLGNPNSTIRGLSVQELGKEDLLLPTFDASAGRLSADGRYLLAVTRNPLGTAFVDLEKGESFTLPDYGDGFYTGDETYPVIGWSYGSTALIVVVREGKDDLLLACDASARRCKLIPADGRVILPWF